MLAFLVLFIGLKGADEIFRGKEEKGKGAIRQVRRTIHQGGAKNIARKEQRICGGLMETSALLVSLII